MMTQELLKSILNYDKHIGIFTWKVKCNVMINIGDVAGSLKQTGYREIAYKQKWYREHKLAFIYEHGYFPKLIDHINGEKADNRIENLREATQSQNQFNSQRINKHNTRNVRFRKDRNKWVITFYTNNTPKQYGSFDNFDEANKVANELRLQFHGNFAYQHRENI